MNREQYIVAYFYTTSSMLLYYARDKFPHCYISKMPKQILRQAQYDLRAGHSELVEEYGMDYGILSRLMYKYATTAFISCSLRTLL